MYTSAITPDLLEVIGRELIRRGELVCLIDTSNGLALWPAQSYDVDGPPDQRRWWYRVTIGGPSHTWTQINVPAGGVLHFRYAVDPAQAYGEAVRPSSHCLRIRAAVQRDGGGVGR